MTPHTFWTLFLKVLGIWLLFDAIALLPEYSFSVFFYKGQDNWSLIITSFVILLSTLALYVLILRYFFFKTDWLIDKLQLDQGFQQEQFTLHLHRSSLVMLSVIIIGGLMLVDSIPQFFRRIFVYFEQENTASRFGLYPNANWIVFYALKGYIGFVMLTRSKRIVALLEWIKRKPSRFWKRRKASWQKG